jgi:hypothetical protein
MLKPGKVATPATAANVAVPASVPLDGLVPIAMVMEVVAFVTVLPCASCTVTCTAGLIAAPVATFVGCTVNASLVAALALLVSEKLAGVAPVALATTLYGPPAVAFAVNTAEVATPLASVVAVFTPPANVPLAPLPGGVYVTRTPLTGLFPASVTVATNGAVKAVLIVALCPEPLVAKTFVAGPGVFVSENFPTVADDPDIDVVTM